MVQNTIAWDVHGNSASLKIERVLQEKLRNKTVRVGIIGLGYVGLPLTLLFSRSGLHTTGFDIDQNKINAISQGRSYINHIPATSIQEQIKGGRFDATTDFDGLAQMDA